MSEFFLELLTEEMPPSHQWVAKEFIREKVEEFLNDKGFSFENIELNTTPRRIILIINGELKAEAGEEIVFGPPVNIAFDEDGNPTQAALGFAKRMGVDVQDLLRVEKEKGEYLAFAKKREAPDFLETFLPFLRETLYSIPFPKTMRWNEYRFSRRVKNVLAIMDGEPVEFEAFGLQANRITHGHRIFSPILMEITNSREYFSLLKEAFVIAKNSEREEKIKEALKIKAEDSLPPSQTLIDYWRDSVEFPNVFRGEFPEKYMELPEEIISTSLEREMGLYLLRDESGAKNAFAGVADNPNSDLKYVIEGNERVAKAKLEDALYFWRRDREKSLEELREELKTVLYNDILGSYYEKTERLEALAEKSAQQIGIDPENLKEAARLCKSDLVTELVGEFPSLQGITGGLILKHQGKNEAVWKAVYEHYRPVSQQDSLPLTTEGLVLSLVDKIDDLVSAFSTGYRPTGSGDPLGTRRAALGIIRILSESNLVVDLEELISVSMGLIAEKITLADKLMDDIKEFISVRLENKLSEDGHRIDMIRAVINSSGLQIKSIFQKLDALMELKERGILPTLIQAHKRVKNILSGKGRPEFNESLLSDPHEKELNEILSVVAQEVENAKEKENYTQILNGLLWLCPFIDELFNNVMIMHEDEKIKNNRIALLWKVNDILEDFADFSQIQEN